MAIAPAITHLAELVPLPETSHYFNREQSWLEESHRDPRFGVRPRRNRTSTSS